MIKRDDELIDNPWTHHELELACGLALITAALAVLWALTMTVRLIDARSRLADCEISREAR